MNRLHRFLAAAAIAALASPALATNGMRMIGFSPTQNAMGGTGVGATLDSGAVLTNPAGITELGHRFDASLTWFKPSVDYTANSADPVNFPVANDGVKYTSDRGGSPIPNIGYVLPINKDLAFGLGAFGVGGMGVDYKPGLYGGRTLTSFMNLRVAPAIAYKVNEMFSAGLTLNGSFAQMEYDVAAGFGQVPHETATSFGYGATLGVKITPMKDLTFGLAYETKSDFQDFEFTIPSHDVPTGLPPPNDVATVPGGTDKLAFDQPAVATVGVAWRAMPALLLAFDVQWINWSDVMGKNGPKYTNDTQLTGALPFNMSWDDQLVFKVGAEFAATDAVKVRAGFDYGKNPLDPDRAFENIAFPAVAESHITAGLGWDITPAWGLQVGGMYSPKTTLKGANAAFPPAGQGIGSYETSMSQYSIDLGVSWKI
jgi:long-chain fatty acid transport protein